MKYFFTSIVFVILFSYISSEISIIGPGEVLKEIKQLIPSGRNFGQVPYGKTLIGKIYFQPQTDGSNYWCDLSQCSEPEDLDKSTDYNPIYLVDHSTSCKYVQKAYNVMKNNGKIMMLISDSNTLNDEFNIDDPLGEKVDIPTVIIPKNVGDILKKYLKENKEKIIVSVSFIMNKDKGKIDIEMYFRSDEEKALNFFREFDYYRKKLGANMTFTPIYKYNIYQYEESDDSISAENSTAPCIKEEKYCVSKNPQLDVENPRIILLENLRQSCIYNLFELDRYWDYMMTFSEMCADSKNPSFSENCAKKAIKFASLSSGEKEIEDCMKNLIRDESKVEDDYQMYNKKRVYRTPELLLNGVKYRGSWFSTFIFDSICSGFFDDEEFCKDESESKQLSGKTIILIVSLGIVGITVLLLLCYKRAVHRSLENSLNERIQIQALRSIKQYNELKESALDQEPSN